MFDFPCSPVSSQDDLTDVYAEEPESPEEHVELYVSDADMSGDQGISVVLDDRA